MARRLTTFAGQPIKERFLCPCQAHVVKHQRSAVAVRRLLVIVDDMPIEKHVPRPNELEIKIQQDFIKQNAIEFGYRGVIV